MSSRRVIALLSLTLLGCDAPHPGHWQPMSCPQPRQTDSTVHGRSPAPTSIDDDVERPDRHLSPLGSGLVVHSLFHLPLLVAAVLLGRATARHRRRAREQRTLALSPSLRPGPSVVVGQVETPGSRKAPLRVHLTQAGSEEVWRGGGRSHVWTEVDREVHVQLFSIRRDDGQLVHVQADGRVRFEAPFTRTEADECARRTHVAVLEQGARVTVSGILSPVDRPAERATTPTSSDEATLHGSEAQSLTISMDGPGVSDERRARFYAIRLLLTAFFFAVGVVFVVPSYEWLVLDGEVEQAVLTARSQWSTWYRPRRGQGRWIRHHAVRGSIARDAVTFSVESTCSAQLYTRMETTPCLSVPFLVSTNVPSIHQLGERATISREQATALVVLMLVATFVGSVWFRVGQPWYDRPKLIETGKGRLPGPPRASKNSTPRSPPRRRG